MGSCQETSTHSLHRVVQKAIQAAIPGSVLEMSFSAIRRVADVAYPPEKLVYEVQYSPISIGEVRKRNRDYASLGYTVIWILHDHCFNKNTLSLAELYLRHSLSYYTSITASESGFFYDQLEVFQNGGRMYRGRPLILNSLLPSPLHAPIPALPKLLQRKIQKNPFYLSGDAVDLLLSAPKKREAIRSFEKIATPRWTFKRKCLTLFEWILKKHAASKEPFSWQTD